MLLFLLIYSQNFIAYGLDIRIKPQAAQQGKVVSFNILSAEGVSRISVSFLGQKFNCFKAADGFKGIIGIPADQKPGSFPLDFFVIKEDGSRDKKTLTVKVRRTKFPSVSFWLKPAKKKLFTKDLIAQEWARIEKKLVVEDSEQGWRGKFILPAKGTTSMVFGTIERVNGRNSGRHRGYDIAVPMGTEVVAPNNGKVVFAEKLKAFGGTMALDHGQGIHTLYFHLSKFMAEIGQNVSKGDVIALSGNSGISSGPHLHWGMSVHNLRVDPAQWVKYAF